MTQINPFVGSIVQSTIVQRSSAIERDRAVQRTQDKSKDSALFADQFEHQVESSDAVGAIGDQSRNPSNHQQPKHHNPSVETPETDDDQPALDITG